MPKVIPFFAILSAGLGVFVLKAPHARLAAQIASGQVDGRRIPVTGFVPARFQEPGNSVRLRELVFQVPRGAKIEAVSSDADFGFLLTLDGLKCRVLPPRRETQDDESDAWGLNNPFGLDELSRRVSICAASGQDLSFWISAPEVQLLQERLEIRPAFALAAERIEVIRGRTLSGLLLTWTIEGSPRMVFTYFSPDKQISGEAFLFPDSDSAEAARAARALVGTFRLESGSLASPVPQVN